jgi:hypothetical protein
MLKLNKIIYLCLLGFVALSCKKDKVEKPPNQHSVDDEVCQEITFSSGEIFGSETTSGVQYTQPCFSPFTDDEFVYFRKNETNFIEFVKYTISTQTEQVLCNSSDFAGLYLGLRPVWGKQHWILFVVGTGSSGIIYKIRDDGSGLKQITPSNMDFNDPKFNMVGDLFVTTGTAVSSLYFPIFNLDAYVVDSVRFSLGNNQFIYPTCSSIGSIKDGLFRFIDNNEPKNKGYGYIFQDSSFNLLFTTDEYQNQLIQASAFQDLIYYLVDYDGLYCYNKNTGIKSLVRKICDTRLIRYMSVSQLTGNMLIEQIIVTKLDENGGTDAQSNIYLFNPITKEKTKVLVE